MASAETTATVPSLEITTSRQMLSWLDEQKLSIALTTYQIGKLFFLGLKPNGELSVFERTFNRCMGLCPTDNGLYMSSLHQIRRVENLLTDGRLVFVNTLFIMTGRLSSIHRTAALITQAAARH